MQEAERVTSREERISGTLQLLGKMLSLPQPPRRMESFDISNIAGTDIVASMVVFLDGRPYKKDYKRFKVEGLEDQDDYASMAQVVHRRFVHYQQGDAGFAQAPDLLLIDGGITHAETRGPRDCSGWDPGGLCPNRHHPGGDPPLRHHLPPGAPKQAPALLPAG